MSTPTFEKDFTEVDKWRGHAAETLRHYLPEWWEGFGKVGYKVGLVWAMYGPGTVDQSERLAKLAARARDEYTDGSDPCEVAAAVLDKPYDLEVSEPSRMFWADIPYYPEHESAQGLFVKGFLFGVADWWRDQTGQEPHGWGRAIEPIFTSIDV